MNDRKRLARILDVRERVRDARRGDLALAQSSLRAAEEHRMKADAALDIAIARLTHPTTIDVHDLMLRSQGAREAQRDAHDAADIIVKRESSVDLERLRVITASKDVKVLEVLDDRLRKVEARAERLAEQAFSDEAAGRVSGMR